jgi:hypothetical protein
MLSAFVLCRASFAGGRRLASLSNSRSGSRSQASTSSTGRLPFYACCGLRAACRTPVHIACAGQCTLHVARRCTLHVAGRCTLHVARRCTLHAQAGSIGSRLFSPQRCWSPRLVCTRCTRATLRSMMECRESAARKPTHPQIEPSAAARASASSHSADTGRVCSSSLTPL